MTQYETLGSEPVSQTAPAGQDVQYEPEFIALQAQIDKLSSPLEREAFSWSAVIEPAADILKNRSKDLFAAVYLSAALISTGKVARLDTGLRLVCDWMDTFWDTGFPPARRLKRREAAIHWWLEWIQAALDTALGEITCQAAEGINAGLQRLQTLLAQCFPAARFEVAGIAAYIQQHAESPPTEETVEDAPDRTPEASVEADDLPVPEPEQAPCEREEAGAVTETETDSPAPSPEPGPDLENTVLLDACDAIEEARDASVNIRTVFGYLADMARLLLELNDADERAYSFARLALYRRLRKPPLLKDGLTTILKPPPPGRADDLKELYDDEAWRELLALSEKTIRDDGQVFYLDLNFYSAAALAALGEPYAMARQAVLAETAWLLRRFSPKLMDMMFRDGTALASETARKWMRREVLGQSSNSGESSAPTSQEAAPTAQSTDRRIEALLSETDTQKALKDFRDHINAAHSGFDAYCWSIGLIRYLDRIERRDVMDGLLNQIETDIDRYGLEQWQPDAARRGWRVLHAVYSRSDTEDDRQAAARILARLAVLDICAAVDA